MKVVFSWYRVILPELLRPKNVSSNEICVSDTDCSDTI